jgi:transposase
MQTRTSMRHIREALRLVYQQGMSRNKAAQALKVGKSTLKEFVKRFEALGMSLEGALSLSDDDLQGHLYPTIPARLESRQKLLIEPDLEHIASELARPGVTIRLLWEEYRKDHPDGFGYTQFWKRCRRRTPSQKLVMRQDHTPGEKVMVDYSGDRLELIDPETGEATPQELFVMVWAASGYVYAEAQCSQKLTDWTMGHVRAFEYFGCVPSIVVPDCLRSAVTKAHRYDPLINRTYVEMCTHYGVVAVPARSREPRDKAKVEATVRIAQQRIIAVLRDRTFHDLADLNRAVREEVERINLAPMQGRDKKCRRDFFDEIDRPAAVPLPLEKWECQQWHVRRVGLDYCVEVDKHWYSVPHALAGRSVDVRVTATAVEAYVDRERVAVHVRQHRRWGHSIQQAHMPEAHRHSLPVQLEQILWRAQRIGPDMQLLVQARIDSVPQPVAALRACLGLIRYAENCHDRKKANRAARFALERRMISCPQFEKILRMGAAENREEDELGVVCHDNLQGLSILAQEG